MIFKSECGRNPRVVIDGVGLGRNARCEFRREPPESGLGRSVFMYSCEVISALYDISISLTVLRCFFRIVIEFPGTVAVNS